MGVPPLVTLFPSSEALMAYGLSLPEPDVDSNSDKLRRSLEEDVARWTPVVEALGLKIE